MNVIYLQVKKKGLLNILLTRVRMISSSIFYYNQHNPYCWIQFVYFLTGFNRYFFISFYVFTQCTDSFCVSQAWNCFVTRLLQSQSIAHPSQSACFKINARSRCWAETEAIIFTPLFNVDPCRLLCSVKASDKWSIMLQNGYHVLSGYDLCSPSPCCVYAADFISGSSSLPALAANSLCACCCT